MQSQSIENIFANEDLMQGGTVWNAVPDYMFTKGRKSYEGLFLQFFTMFNCLKSIFIFFYICFEVLDKKSYPEIKYNSLFSPTLLGTPSCHLTYLFYMGEVITNISSAIDAKWRSDWFWYTCRSSWANNCLDLLYK